MLTSGSRLLHRKQHSRQCFSRQMNTVQLRRAVQAKGFLGVPGSSDLRAAIAQRLANARTWQDVQSICSRFGDQLTPREIQQLVSLAPVMKADTSTAQLPNTGQRPQQPVFGPRSLLGHRRANPQTVERELQARRQQAAAEQQQYEGLMHQLARMAQRNLPQCDGHELADTAYALAHAGVLDVNLAQQLLQHTAQLASAGKLSVQGLADVFKALGAAKFVPSPPAMQQLLTDVDPLTRCTSLQELSALLEGLSRLGYKPDDAFVEAAMQRLQQRQTMAARQQGPKQRISPSQQQAKAMGLPTQRHSSDSESSENEDIEAKELEEARHVAAAIQALQRMGHFKQASHLQSTYLRDLQARAAARLQAREQKQREAEGAERERQEQLRAASEAEKRRLAEQRAAAERARLEQERRAVEARRALEAKQAAEERKAAEERATRQAVSSSIQRAQSWQQLRNILYNFPSYLGIHELTVMLGRLQPVLQSLPAVSWSQRAELSGLLEQWGSLMVERIQKAEHVDNEDLIDCLTYLTELRWQEQQVLGALLRAAKLQLPNLNPDQLIRLSGALSAAGLRPSQAWITSFVERSAEVLNDLNAGQLYDVATHLARLGISPGSTWMMSYLAALQNKESVLSSQEAVLCLRAAAALDGPLVQRWYNGLINSRRTQARQQQLQGGSRPSSPTNKNQGAHAPKSTTNATSTSSGGSAARQQQQPVTVSSLSEEDVIRELSGGDEDSDTDDTNEKFPQSQGNSKVAREPRAAGSAGNSRTPISHPLMDVDSIDFDEELGSTGNGQQLPDTFLLSQMQPAGNASRDAINRTGSKTSSNKQVNTGAMQQGAPKPQQSKQQQQTAQQQQRQAATPAELKGLRSALLERLELAQDTADRCQQAVKKAGTRSEAAATQVSAIRSQLDILQGDYDRVKARVEREKLDVTQQARIDVLKRLLPVLDNFERASQSLQPKTQGEKLVHKSYQEVAVKLQDILKSSGIQEVAGEGKAFDPAIHDAIMQEYDASVPDGTVLQVLQKGYQLGDKLIRPALVKVSTC